MGRSNGNEQMTIPKMEMSQLQLCELGHWLISSSSFAHLLISSSAHLLIRSLLRHSSVPRSGPVERGYASISIHIGSKIYHAGANVVEALNTSVAYIG